MLKAGDFSSFDPWFDSYDGNTGNNYYINTYPHVLPKVINVYAATFDDLESAYFPGTKIYPTKKISDELTVFMIPIFCVQYGQKDNRVNISIERLNDMAIYGYTILESNDRSNNYFKIWNAAVPNTLAHFYLQGEISGLAYLRINQGYIDPSTITSESDNIYVQPIQVTQSSCIIDPSFGTNYSSFKDKIIDISKKSIDYYLNNYNILGLLYLLRRCVGDTLEFTKTYTNSTWDSSKTWYIKVDFFKGNSFLSVGHANSNVVNYVTMIRNNQYKNVA